MMIFEMSNKDLVDTVAYVLNGIALFLNSMRKIKELF